jgi:signal transduction histidine kinase
MKLHRLKVLAPYTLALLSAAVIGWAAWRLIRHPDAGAYWSSIAGNIVWVQPGGPADGFLKLGDRILAIDGEQLSDVLLFQDKQPGDWANFVIDRAGDRQSVWLRLEPPALPIVLSNLEPLLIALVFWGVGVAILAFSPPGNQSLHFFIFCQVSSAALAAGAMSSIGPPLATRLFGLLLWWVGPLAVHFHLYFPTRAPSPRRYLLIVPFYCVAIAGSLLDVLADPLALREALPILYSVRRAWLAGGLIVAVILLARAYRRATRSEPRRQVGLVALGGLTGLLPLVVFSLLPDTLTGQPVLSYDITFLFLSALPLSYAYAIARYRLMGLDRYVSRSATYMLVVALWGGAYLVLSVALAHWLPSSLWQQPAVNLGVALLLALTFSPLYRQIDVWVHTLFYGSRYDYRHAVKRMSQVIGGATGKTDPTGLAHNLCLGLQQAMQLECTCLLLPDGGGATAICSESCGLQHPPHLNAQASAALQQCLRDRDGVIDANALRHEIAQTDGLGGAAYPGERPIVCDQAQLCLALNIGESDGRKGLLMLSQKRGQGLFDAADLDILEVITRQAGIAFVNARLAADAQQRAREIEKLHHRLLLAREDERRRLARELHDETIQQVVGLNFHLSSAQTSEGLTQVRTDVHTILAGLRRVTGELRPPALDSLGLVPVMRSQLRELSSQVPLRTTLDVEGGAQQELPEEISMALFRVFQEAVLNAQRHAAARRLEVTLRFEPERVVLLVTDDGCGFAVPQHLSQLVAANHFGLAGLRERVELLGGTLAVQSAPGQGCRVEARIPLKTKEKHGNPSIDSR